MREYCEQLCAGEMDSLEGMDRRWEKPALPRLNQEETEVRNNPATNTEIETVIKSLPKNKARGPMVSQGNSIKHLEKS